MSQTCRRTLLTKIKQQNVMLPTLLAELIRSANYWFQVQRTTARTTNAKDVNEDCFQMLLQSCVQILQHGFAFSLVADQTRSSLVDDFEFLRLTVQMQHHSLASASPRIQSSTASEFLRLWVERCLRTRCLAQCLQALVTDKELLEHYYLDMAFLRQSNYATALFICLTAIQQNQCNLLSQLDAKLWQTVHTHKLKHRRTSSQPNFSIFPRLEIVPEAQQIAQKTSMQHAVSIQFRRVKSLPCLVTETDSREFVAARRRCQTFSTARFCPRKRPFPSWYSPSSCSPCSHDELDMTPSTSACSRRSQLSTDSCSSSAGSTSTNSKSSSSTMTSPQVPNSHHIQLINCDNIKIWTDQSEAAAENTATPTDLLQTLHNSKPPVKHASPLNNFLTNLFGAQPVYTSWYINGLGCTETQLVPADSVLDTFLPVNGKKLHKRGKQNLFEDAGVSMLDYASVGSSVRDDTTPRPTTPLNIVGSSRQEHCLAGSASFTSGSSSSISTSKADNQSLAAFLQMSRYTHNNTDLEKENAHFRISEACITAIEHVKWTRQSEKADSSEQPNNEMCTKLLTQLPYVEHIPSDGAESHTAEAVGLQLISKFNDQQLPKLSDLKWLVSEEDAPQQLLPLPKQLEEQQQQSGTTRGTKTWAPPRQQIIFTEHAPASRSEILTRQNYRCAGCGMRVTKQFMQHFRYCTYLGKYLCTGCHRNQISTMPSKILQHWDFRFYPVSVFAYRLIEQMYTFPLFYVPHMNPQLYIKQKCLATARRRRVQLQFVKEFIDMCRFASKEKTFFEAIPTHIIYDPDLWSMADFVDVQNKSMIRSIEEIISLSEQHVFNCVLCTGRAFICDYCNNPKMKLIYPWQRKVRRCGSCGSCAHRSCWNGKYEACLRCERINGRQQKNITKS